MGEGFELLDVPIETDTAQAIHAAQKPVAGELFVEAQDAFFEPHRMGIGDGEGHVGGDGADVGDVVIEAFEFQADGAQGPGAGWSFKRRGPLDRMAEGSRVSKAGVAGDALRQADAMRDRNVFKEFLGAFVGIEKADLEIKDRFAGNAEEEMAGFNDARVDRTHRDLKDTFAFDLAEFVAFARERSQDRPQVEILTKRIDFWPIIVERAPARVGMAFEFEAEEVLDFALLPIGGRESIGEGDELRFVGRNGNAQDKKAVGVIESEDVIKMKDTCQSTGVIGKEADQAAVPFLIELGAETGDKLDLGVKVDFVRAGGLHSRQTRAETLGEVGENGLEGRGESHGNDFGFGLTAYLQG